MYTNKLIDHIFSNLYEYECTGGNLYYDYSDHYHYDYGSFLIHGSFLIVKNLLATLHAPVRPTAYRRNFQNVDIKALERDFDEVQWESKVIYGL